MKELGSSSMETLVPEVKEVEEVETKKDIEDLNVGDLIEKFDELDEKIFIEEASEVLETKEILDQDKFPEFILEELPPEELQIYKDANLQLGEVNGRPSFKNMEIDPLETDDFGRTNKERMDAGLPALVNGEPLELHHVGQKSEGGLAELTPEQHRGKGNYSVLHDVGKESEIDRTAFGKERQEYWKERSKEF